MRKDLHVYFPDNKAFSIPVKSDDPVCEIWPSSEEVRKIIGVETFKEACEIARRDDRTVRRYVLHKVKEHLGLLSE